MRYELKNVAITSFNTSGSGASADLPSEHVTIAYTPIKVSYSHDEFEFTSSEDGVEKPKFEWIEIKAPPKPPSHSLAENVEDFVFGEDQDLDPLGGLLLPAVQAAHFAAVEDETHVPVWDDFAFG